MKKNFLMVVDGLNGAGKSTIAKSLHERLKRTALIPYDKIKRLISDFTPNQFDHELANHVVRVMAKEYLDHGINVIIESYIPSKKIAQYYTSLARREGVHLFYFQLEAPLDVRAARIRERPLAEGAKKKLTRESIEMNDAVYFKNKFKKAQMIETGDMPIEATTSLILEAVSRAGFKEHIL